MRRFILLIILSITISVGLAQAPGVVYIEGRRYAVHRVAAGETIYSLAKQYGVTEDVIVRYNPQTVEGLQAGQVIKVPVPEPVAGPAERVSYRRHARMYERHVVNQGETTYSIAKRYGLSVNTLLEDNPGLDPLCLSIGQSLNIRKSEMGESSSGEISQELNTYKNTLNSVSDTVQYHLVAQGETIYSLSRFFGVSQDEIISLNDLNQGLKTGMIIKVPRQAPQAVTIEPDTVSFADTWEPDSLVLKTDYRVRKLHAGQPARIALLLPFTSSNQREQFTAFYQGVLLGLEDLKAQGHSFIIDVYDTQRSPETVRQIVNAPGFETTDLIIGPIYEEAMAPAVRFSREHHVPVVSPLAVLEEVHSPLVYQLSPAPSHKYDSLRGLFADDKNIVLITARSHDQAFEDEIMPLIHAPYRKISYSKEDTGLDALFSAEKENVFVVLSADEVGVDMILAALSSVQNNRVARSIKCAPVRVVGHARWQKYRNMDKNLFFKLDVMLVPSYHADRTDPEVAAFDRRYVAAFGMLPNLYSYRGYDAVKLFASSLYAIEDDFTERVNENREPLLQVRYVFERENTHGNVVNRHWPVVKYHPDYTISVE